MKYTPSLTTGCNCHRYWEPSRSCSGCCQVSLRKHPFLLALRRWRSFARTQQQKFHGDDVNQCLKKKSGSHGVPNANLFNFTFLLVDFGKVMCSSTNELQQNSNAFFQRRLNSANIDCFVRDSSCLHLTFVAFYLLSVIRQQQLKQCNYSVDQSGLLIGFRTYFTPSVMQFLSLSDRDLRTFLSETRYSCGTDTGVALDVEGQSDQ